MHRNVVEETGFKQLVSCNFILKLRETNFLKLGVFPFFPPVCASCDVTALVHSVPTLFLQNLCCRFAPAQMSNALQLLVVVGILKLKVSCGTITLFQSDSSRVSYCRPLQHPAIGIFVVTYLDYRTSQWFRLVREPCDHTNSISDVCSAHV